MSLENESQTLSIVRLYDAPLALVWEAWADAERISQWWGPRGFTLTTHSKNLCAGGIWHYTMHGPDGTDYPNKTKYYDVKPQVRLEYDHGGYDDRESLFHVVVEFKAIENKTQMDMTMTFKTVEMAIQMKQFIKEAGGDTTWDRLGEYIQSVYYNKEVFIINRSFSQPIDIVFDAWTNPHKLSQWLAPKGSEMTFYKCDIKSHGEAFYSMSNAHFKLYGRTEYLEINPPYELVYKQQFCDENQNVTRHPMAPKWPETMLTHVQFFKESKNGTRVTVTWEVFGDCHADELSAFMQARAGMTQGWTGSFDKLEVLFGSEIK